MLDTKLIEQAARILEGRIRRTELIHSHYFSEQFGIPLHFKCENLQRTGSFKVRGAFNFVHHQSKESLRRGVITASAGNHAQGLAYAAGTLGIPVTVVMPETTPLAKILACRGYGAEIVLYGSDVDEAIKRARQIQEERRFIYVPPFDHPLIMAGQGSIGLEILEELPSFDTLLIPVGGGGLIAGIATAVKDRLPKVRIVGVETTGTASAALARRIGAPQALPAVHSLADGIAVKRIGERTFPVIEALVDDLVTVEEEQIAQAIVALMEKAKLVVEGAGAVGLAALLSGSLASSCGRTVCLLSGGNIDVQTISRVVERGMLAEGRYLKVRVELPDVPGALARLAAVLAEQGANIYHVSHDRLSTAVPLGRAEVDLKLETRGPEHIEALLGRLRLAGYRAEPLP